MKKTKYNISIFTFVFLLLSFAFTTTFAQVEEKPEAKVDGKTKIENSNSIEANGDKIEFKNETGNSIFTIADQGSSTPRLTFRHDSGYNSRLSTFGDDILFQNFGAGGFSLATSTSLFTASIRFKLTNDGKVGIGTTYPASTLSVGGIGLDNVTIYGKTLTGSGIYGEATHGRGIYGKATDGSGIGVIGASSGASGKGVVGSGNSYDFDAQGTGVNYGSTSSRRWKKNIVEIDNPLEMLSNLRGVYFNWDEEHGGLHDVGMIAEEVGKVLPEIVVYEENGIDADGMDYSKLTPLLVEVAKTQQKKIEELDKKLSKLESLLEGKRFTTVSK